MRTNSLIAIALGVALASGCSKKKDKEEPKAPVAEGKDGGVVADDSPSAAAADTFDASAADALWALAPQGTGAGAVMAAGTGATLHGGMMRFLDIASAQPMGAQMVAKMRAETKAEPVDVLDRASIEKAGIDVAGAAAVFMQGKKKGVMLLPVKDRAALRKVTKGKVETVDGLEVDKHDDDFVCAEKSSRYVCAPDLEQLKAYEPMKDNRMAKKVAELPAHVRGHIEGAVDFAVLREAGQEIGEDFTKFVADPGLAFGSARIADGTLTMRLSVEGKPNGPAAVIAKLPATLAETARANHPTAVFRLSLPTELVFAQVPEQTLPGGTSLKNDILGNLTGEFVAYAPAGQTPWGRLAIGVEDGAPFKKLIDAGCEMAAAQSVPGLSATSAPSGCRLQLDFSKLPAMDPSMAKWIVKPLAVMAEVAGDHVAITVGAPADPDTSHQMSRIGQTMLDEKWTLAVWVQSFMIARDIGPALPQLAQTAPPDAVEGIRFGAWLIAHLSEFAMAGAVRDDGVHALFHIETYLADDEAVYEQYAAAVKKGLTGQAIDAELAAIAQSAPGSRVAQSVKAGIGGSMLAAGVTGMLAAVAIPAFLKYRARAQETPIMPPAPPPPAKQ